MIQRKFYHFFDNRQKKKTSFRWFKKKTIIFFGENIFYEILSFFGETKKLYTRKTLIFWEQRNLSTIFVFYYVLLLEFILTTLVYNRVLSSCLVLIFSPLLGITTSQVNEITNIILYM